MFQIACVASRMAATQVPSVVTFSPVSSTGATYPWYAAVTNPSSIYVSSTTTTWFTWEAWVSSDRVYQVVTYNHTTGQWSPVYTAAQGGLTDDDHGVPTILRDSDGYFHIFFGNHFSRAKQVNSTYADEPALWSGSTFVGIDNTTYNHPILIGTTLYLFLRGQGDDSESTFALYKTTAKSLGTLTWDTQVVLADSGASSRFYPGTTLVSGSKVHLVATISDHNDTYRRDVYYLIYNSANGQIENLAGTSNAVPLNLATLNSTYKIVSQPTPAGGGNIPALCFDQAGASHVLYMDGVLGGTAFDVYHIVYSGGTWSTPYKVGTSYSKDSEYGITPAANGGVAAYWMQQSGTPAWYSGSGRRDGGDLWRAQRSSGGSWGPSYKLANATSFALNEPSMVLNGHADARVTFCEVTQDSTTESGALKGFCYGDSGSLAWSGTNPYVPPTHFTFSHLSSGSVLSNNYLTVTTNSTRSWNQARGIVIIGNTEQKYWEMVVNNLVTAGDFSMGLISSASGNADTAYIGFGTDSVGYFGDGTVYQNNTLLINLGAGNHYTTADNISFAYDRSANKLWVRKNGGNWNNAVIGSQNPATGTGGISVNAYTTPVPAVNMKTSGEGITAKFASADWTYTAPSGFTAMTR